MTGDIMLWLVGGQGNLSYCLPEEDFINVSTTLHFRPLMYSLYSRFSLIPLRLHVMLSSYFRPGEVRAVLYLLGNYTLKAVSQAEVLKLPEVAAHTSALCQSSSYCCEDPSPHNYTMTTAWSSAQMALMKQEVCEGLK